MQTRISQAPPSPGYTPLLQPSEQEEVFLGAEDTDDQNQAPLDIVQFNSQVYFADEDDGKVDIGVMRMGSAVGRAEAFFQTVDGSAKSGDQYEATSGSIVFEPGEKEKRLTVTIHDDDMWHATNEFKLQLSEPVGCTLGNYLHTARVKVLDNNSFPSDKYVEEVRMGKEGVDIISGAGLFWEYFKLNFQQDGIWWRTVLTIVFDQLHNINVLLQTWMSMYMVDVVFSRDFDPKDLRFFHTREAEVYLLAALNILPIACMHVWDYFRVKIDICGHSEAFLRSNIVRRYMNLAEDSRIQLDASRLQVAILDDTAAIAHGYCSVLDMVKSIGTVNVLTIFTLHSNRAAWWVVLCMPVLMGLFLAVRDWIGEALDNVPEKKALMGLLNEMLRNYKLISSYHQRPRINDMVGQAVGALREKKIPMEISAKHDEYFPLWMGAMLCAIYIVITGPNVLKHNVSLGTFLATISVIRDTSGAFSLLYSVYMKLAETFDPVREITWVFSLKTDLHTWKHVSHKRQQMTSAARAEVSRSDISRGFTGSNSSTDDGSVPSRGQVVATGSGPTSQRWAVDRLTISLGDVSFHYNGQRPVFRNVKLSVEQGSIVAVSGTHGSGKSTLLQLLGHSLFPKSGDMFVPGHLRILQVDVEVMIFESWGPLENLTFGVGAEGVDLDKVREIVEEVSMDLTWSLVQEELAHQMRKSSKRRTLMEMQADPDEDQYISPWHERLSATEKAKMCLARALIANPEVLILHKPFRNYREEEKKKVMQVILKHVHNRGIGMPPESVSLRRPRSCFYSVVNTEDQCLADEVWSLDDAEQTVSVEKGFGDKSERLERIGRKGTDMDRLIEEVSQQPSITQKIADPTPHVAIDTGLNGKRASRILEYGW